MCHVTHIRRVTHRTSKKWVYVARISEWVMGRIHAWVMAHPYDRSWTMSHICAWVMTHAYELVESSVFICMTFICIHMYDIHMYSYVWHSYVFIYIHKYSYIFISIHMYDIHMYSYVWHSYVFIYIHKYSYIFISIHMYDIHMYSYVWQVSSMLIRLKQDGIHINDSLKTYVSLAKEPYKRDIHVNTSEARCHTYKWQKTGLSCKRAL